MLTPAQIDALRAAQVVTEGRWQRTSGPATASPELCARLEGGNVEYTIDRIDAETLSFATRTQTLEFKMADDGAWVLEGEVGTDVEYVTYRIEAIFDGTTGTGTYVLRRPNAPGGPCEVVAPLTYTYLGE